MPIRIKRAARKRGKETRRQRSRIMRAVKSADTEPERIVRRLVSTLGYRYRLQRADLPGAPDLAFASLRKVIFVHGCFWHGHSCRRGARVPKSNREYWVAKISRNKRRDRSHLAKLRKLGWRSLAVWECQLREQVRASRRIERFLLS